MSSIDVVTRTVTVNRAFLQEIKDANQEMWSVLSECRRACGEPVRRRQQASTLAELLRDLCDHVALHFSLEEAYGYFEDPVSVAPRLAQRCEKLRREHAALYVELAELADLADQYLHDPEGVTNFITIQSQFVTFDERFQDHEAQEIDLIQTAFGEDIGVGD